MKFADITNDVAFKKIFANEAKKDILISFLNAVLDFKDEMQIIHVELANPYQVPKIEELKETILDIKATNQRKEHFIVEMQKNDKGDFAKRSLYYTSKAYVSQLESGDKYWTLKKVYFIGILNFTMFETNSYITRHLILNKETLKQEIQDFEFTFIELPKFKKELHELFSILDKWIYFIKNAKNLTLIPSEYESIKEFKEAFEIATQYTWDKKEMEIYDYVDLREQDRLNEIYTAEKKGIEKTKIEIAKNLLDILDNKTISLKTGLDEDFIESLRKKLQN